MMRIRTDVDRCTLVVFGDVGCAMGLLADMASVAGYR
jgi:hypothetical protein